MSGSGRPKSGITVGIDIGTTSVKALAVDDEGQVLARARVPHGVVSPFAGAFEHDVDLAWRANVITALDEVSTGLDVAAVNVSAMVPSLAAVDSGGRALSPGLLYGDVRGRTVDNVASEPGDAGEVLAFLRWLTERSPGAAGYWPAQAVANHALTGIGAIDGATASTAHPLHDYRRWDEEQATSAGATVDQLPKVVGGVRPVGRVLDGLPAAGALVGAGTIDALGEQVVAGADSTGDVLVILGATLIVWSVIPEWTTVAGLWTVPHTAPGMIVIGGPSTAGGMFVDAVDRWAAPATAEQIAAVDPADLPVWLPYVRGERCPLHRPELRAEVHDVTLHHGPAEIRAAALEATGFVVRHLLDLAVSAGSSPRRVVATGGGTRSTPWMQALADTTGLPVDVVAVPEGAALGAAFGARCVADLETSDAPFGPNITDARRWARTAARFDPDPVRELQATDRYHRFRALTGQLGSDPNCPPRTVGV